MDLPIPTWHVMKPIFISYSKKREFSITWNIVQWNFKTKKNTVRSTTSTHSQTLFIFIFYALQSLLFAEFTTQSYKLFNVSVIKGWERRVTGKGEKKKRFSVFMVKHYSLIITCTFIKHCSFTIYFFNLVPVTSKIYNSITCFISFPF